MNSPTNFTFALESHPSLTSQGPRGAESLTYGASALIDGLPDRLADPAGQSLQALPAPASVAPWPPPVMPPLGADTKQAIDSAFTKCDVLYPPPDPTMVMDSTASRAAAIAGLLLAVGVYPRLLPVEQMSVNTEDRKRQVT
jgi:hypothetical protein